MYSLLNNLYSLCVCLFFGLQITVCKSFFDSAIFVAEKITIRKYPFIDHWFFVTNCNFCCDNIAPIYVTINTNDWMIQKTDMRVICKNTFYTSTGSSNIYNLHANK